jgi:hypothetical protein
MPSAVSHAGSANGRGFRQRTSGGLDDVIPASDIVHGFTKAFADGGFARTLPSRTPEPDETAD